MKHKVVVVPAKQKKKTQTNTNFIKVNSLLLSAIWQCTEPWNDVQSVSALMYGNNLHQEFIIWGQEEIRVFIVIALQSNSQKSKILKQILSNLGSPWIN